jgi:tetratricopeptide (TPR) repeat protein
VLLGEVKSALAVGDADKADRPLGLAEKRAGDLGGGEYRERVARGRKDVNMLRQVDALDAQYYEDEEQLNGDGDRQAAVLPALAAFADYGLTYGMAPADAARVVHSSLIRETLECTLARGFSMLVAGEGKHSPLLTAARLVHSGGKVPFTGEGFASYLDAIDDTDTDGYRRQVREAIWKRDKRRAAELLKQRERVEQPPHFVHMIATTNVVPVERRVAVLRESFARRPSDFRLHFGLWYLTRDPKGTGDTLPPHARSKYEAADWLRGAVALRPKNPVAWSMLGLELRRLASADVALRTELRAEALGAYRQALQLAPDVPTHRINLARAHYLLKEYAAAEDEWRVVLAADPKCHHAHYYIARAYFYQGDYSMAACWFHRGLALNPGQHDLQFRLNETLEKLQGQAKQQRK